MAKRNTRTQIRRQGSSRGGGAPGGLTHLDARGAARMVDVGPKAATLREARASGRLRLRPATLALLRSGRAAKGDVLAAARIAGIQAAKETWRLIPLCHLLPLDSVAVDFGFLGRGLLGVSATARATARTGVEMEALAAVAAACLTVYDMLKAVDRGMTIERIRLEEKTGGKRAFRRGRSGRP
jgi:cyclic pyranopterin monophosphate synthase